MVRRRSRRGANAVEFALTAPMLFALMTGMMDLCFHVALHYAASASAQHAVRMGALTARDHDPEGVALEQAYAKWKALGLSVTPTIVTFRTDGTPELIVARVVVDAKPLVGLVPMDLSFEVTRMRRMEQQP